MEIDVHWHAALPLPIIIIRVHILPRNLNRLALKSPPNGLVVLHVEKRSRQDNIWVHVHLVLV